jgi:hypothetical protein
MPTSDLTGAIEQSHAALGTILTGDPSVPKRCIRQPMM